MQTVLTYFALIFAGMLSAQNSITITISNLASNNGKAMIALYNSEASFLGDPELGSIDPVKPVS